MKLIPWLGFAMVLIKAYALHSADEQDTRQKKILGIFGEEIAIFLDSKDAPILARWDSVIKKWERVKDHVSQHKSEAYPEMRSTLRNVRSEIIRAFKTQAENFAPGIKQKVYAINENFLFRKALGLDPIGFRSKNDRLFFCDLHELVLKIGQRVSSCFEAQAILHPLHKFVPQKTNIYHLMPHIFIILNQDNLPISLSHAGVHPARLAPDDE